MDVIDSGVSVVTFEASVVILDVDRGAVLVTDDSVVTLGLNIVLNTVGFFSCLVVVVSITCSVVVDLTVDVVS